MKNVLMYIMVSFVALLVVLPVESQGLQLRLSQDALQKIPVTSLRPVKAHDNFIVGGGGGNRDCFQSFGVNLATPPHDKTMLNFVEHGCISNFLFGDLMNAQSVLGIMAQVAFWELKESTDLNADPADKVITVPINFLIGRYPAKSFLMINFAGDVAGGVAFDF